MQCIVDVVLNITEKAGDITSSPGPTPRASRAACKVAVPELNATEYISGTGPGSLRYINEEDFSGRNIKLTWQEYKHPEYAQLYGEFISHLSVIDLLFINGDKSKEVIKWKQ